MVIQANHPVFQTCLNRADWIEMNVRLVQLSSDEFLAQDPALRSALHHFRSASQDNDSNSAESGQD